MSDLAFYRNLEQELHTCLEMVGNTQYDSILEHSLLRMEKLVKSRLPQVKQGYPKVLSYKSFGNSPKHVIVYNEDDEAEKRCNYETRSDFDKWSDDYNK